LSASASRSLKFVALTSVALVYLLPFLVATERGLGANTGGLLLLIATIPVAAALSALPAAVSYAWHYSRGRSVNLRLLLALLLLVPAVSTLPGMVEVHRAFGRSSNYLPNIIPSLVLIVLNVTVFLNLPILRPQITTANAVYGSLFAASLTNLIFPWWPLD